MTGVGVVVSERSRRARAIRPFEQDIRAVCPGTWRNASSWWELRAYETCHIAVACDETYDPSYGRMSSRIKRVLGFPCFVSFRGSFGFESGLVEVGNCVLCID